MSDFRVGWSERAGDLPFNGIIAYSLRIADVVACTSVLVLLQHASCNSFALKCVIRYGKLTIIVRYRSHY